MSFDPSNKIVQLCGQGMLLEGEGKNKEAKECFQSAWEQATNDFERFTAAHYLARQQNTTNEKLDWDLKALELALGLNDEKLKGAYPSLYLNIAKGYEDLKEYQKAKENYQLAQSYTNHLLDDGYGNMIKGGIENGLRRI